MNKLYVSDRKVDGGSPKLQEAETAQEPLFDGLETKQSNSKTAFSVCTHGVIVCRP